MLKYFRRQKSQSDSFDENDQCYRNNSNINTFSSEVDSGSSDDAPSSTTNDYGVKRQSLRSTSIFCDEVFLEELSNLSLFVTPNIDGIQEDALSYSALSLGAISNDANYNIASGSGMVLNSIEVDEDLFKYHSRLSMIVTSIVNEPNCLSYFVQYLEKRDALPLIKFYLDTENFKNAALAQLRKEKKHKFIEQQISGEQTASLQDISQTKNESKNGNDHITQNINKRERNEERMCIEVESSDIGVSNVPELKTLCDLTMRKPLTDDEKSQIYAETNKKLTKCSVKCKSNVKVSSELSLCSVASGLTQISECVPISLHSVQDALTIYQKYLSANSSSQISMPLDILSKISLALCKKDEDIEKCAITSDCFTEAQKFILIKLEKEFLNDFLQSAYYAKYCVELIQGQNLNINDILHSEVTLFYLMEYLEQHKERDCLEFWSSAINYRKTYLSQEAKALSEKEAQSDAMIIYEKYFSLQTELKLWSSNKLRSHVESYICTEGLVFHCFDLPLQAVAKYLECKYLKMFLKSPLFDNYLNELKSRIDEDIEQSQKLSKVHGIHKPLRRSVSDRISNRRRKTLSDCTLEKKVPISQQNTLLASMDSYASHLKQFQLNIDSSQMTNPDLLWQRSNSNNLKFGRVNSLGRYERDFISPADALHVTSSKSNNNWSFNLSGNKIKNAVRKLVHLPDNNVQEEIAWQVAEMIVKDVTSVTMRQDEDKIGCAHKQKS